MRVKCISNSGNTLSEKYIINGELPTAEYPLSVGNEYTVYGISQWKNVIYYLTINKYNTLPSWYPADLFEITDNLLPIEWYYNCFKNSETLSAIWGYSELALIEKHYEDLIERNDNAIKIFLKRKSEIDNY